MGIAILSPHFDDAVLSCWHLLDGRGDVLVVNVFTALPPAGTPLGWWDTQTGATDAVERTRERRAEDAEALALTGRTAVALDLLDDQYRTAPLDLAELDARLTAVVAHGATLYAPLAADGHPDHVA